MRGDDGGLRIEDREGRRATEKLFRFWAGVTHWAYTLSAPEFWIVLNYLTEVCG